MHQNHTVSRQRQRFLAVVWTGAVYWLTGILTWTYPPDYLAYGKVWAVVFVVAGWLAWMTLIHRNRWMSALSGGLLVGGALFRSLAIFVELGFDRWLRAFYVPSEPPPSSSFSIAGMTWLLIAVLLWVGWPQIQAGLLEIGDSQDGE